MRSRPWPRVLCRHAPLADGKSDHDDFILWLAGKEARTLLNALPATKN